MPTSHRPALNRFALGRALTALANASALEMLHRVSEQPSKRHARRIGFTGAPGAGKSTLSAKIALHRATSKSTAERVGMIASDPSSPNSGGAILGDRIRMDDLPGSSELYIRSLGSRSAADGLTDNLPEMLDLMDTFDFDEVLLETVGVGQAEYAVRQQVDTLVLVLIPNSGDIVQAMKSGIMEMADIFVVNKADLPGAQRMAADIQRITSLGKHTSSQWQAPVLLVSSTLPDSIAELSQTIDRHQEWIASTGERERTALGRARYRLRRVIERQLIQVIDGLSETELRQPLPRQLSTVLSALDSRH